MGRKSLPLKFFAAILLSLGLLVLGGLNIQQKRVWVAPDDGASWIQSNAGIQASQIVADGPAGISSISGE